MKDIENAFIVILENSHSIKNDMGSSYSPEGKIIINKAMEKAKDCPHLYTFLRMWDEDKLQVIVR